MSTTYHHDNLYQGLDSQVPRNLVSILDLNKDKLQVEDFGEGVGLQAFYKLSFLEMHNNVILVSHDGLNVNTQLLLPSIEELVLAASSGNGLTEGRALHFVVKNYSTSGGVTVVPSGGEGEFVHKSTGYTGTWAPGGDLSVAPGESADFLIRLNFLNLEKRTACGDVAPLACRSVASLQPANTFKADADHPFPNKPTATDCCSDRLAIARACNAQYVLYVSGCCRAGPPSPQ